ncbi:MAG: molybdopterin-dependent oxidoreductase [Methanoregula sp.]|jgi:DMSO/TMAO reductase YedYZ molybdopterin-dependent catalytic subunit|uniref:molybdopterin-dependent oxidoreductase n=1 Tax=Methanoregula sp. TaxID=2052170 RepID=UPI003C23063C
MNPRSYRVITLVIAVVIIVLVVAFLSSVFRSGSSSNGITNLAAVEVRSYQGQDLSSISDVPENAIIGTQHINESDYRLTITGLTTKTTVSTYGDILNNHQHYTKVVTLNCVEGWSVKILWEGVLVKDLINEAGVDPRANTVIFHATDGYTTSFPLSYVMDNNIIIAYKMNNITIDAEHGYPFRLVAEDKWGYKWIKWIDEIELSDNPNYQGYWEQRGYSNSGNLSESQYS